MLSHEHGTKSHLAYRIRNLIVILLLGSILFYLFSVNFKTDKERTEIIKVEGSSQESPSLSITLSKAIDTHVTETNKELSDYNPVLVKRPNWKRAAIDGAMEVFLFTMKVANYIYVVGCGPTVLTLLGVIEPGVELDAAGRCLAMGGGLAAANYAYYVVSIK